MVAVRKKRFPWVPASALAALVILIVVTLIQVPPKWRQAARENKEPSLRLVYGIAAGQGDATQEQMEAYDPTPLVLPTRWNSFSERPVRRRGAETFDAVPPQLFFPEGEAHVDFPTPRKLPSGPVEAARSSLLRDFSLEMGRADAGRQLAARLGFLRVVEMGKGDAMARTLELKDEGGGLLPTQKDWQPMELSGAVSPEGLVGGLIVLESSGVDEIDDFFKKHLEETVRVGDLLAPGFYVFRVGP